jgi:prepilin-type N-terminal cleavage/methylation domain-containing protein
MNSKGFKGFTLIELLVAVLIITILAAIALPQYLVSVAKSRGTQCLVDINYIKKAQEMYRLQNGNYAGALEELDLDSPTKTTLAFYKDGRGSWIYTAQCTRYHEIIYHINTQKIYCGARRHLLWISEKICSSYGGQRIQGDFFTDQMDIFSM